MLSEVFWIAFISTMTGCIIPKNINFKLLFPKVIFKCILDPPKDRIDESIMLASNDIFILGSSFIIYKDLVNRLEKLYEKKIIEWQSKCITDDDQNLFLQLFFDNPQLFQFIKHPKWFGMYHELQLQID